MKTNNRLREALKKILDLTNSLDEDCAVDPVEIRDIAKAALAEPIKNCEVGTPEEQNNRHDRYCGSQLLCGGTCVSCFARWAQMPYEEGGAK